MFNMELKQRFTCALVCSDWAKAAAATTHSIVRDGLQDLNGLQKWLDKNGGQMKTMQLRRCRETGMSRLPCPQLQDLLLHGFAWNCKLVLEVRVWTDIAAATKLTSLSLQRVCTDSQQADVVSALTALPDLQQLSWREVECGQTGVLSDSRLLQHLTKLTGLDLEAASAEALQHLSSLSKLQQLGLNEPRVLVAVKVPGLQQLKGLTSLKVDFPLQGLPSAVSHLTALQQLKVCEATATELECLKALTALTKLCVSCMKGVVSPDTTPLQLPTLHSLDLGINLDDDEPLHMSQLSSCTQLRRLSLQLCRLVGPDSLAASSMLQELDLQYCSLSSPEGPACVDPWQLVFPGPGRLPHLTSLVLRSVSPAPQQADLERLVACCSGLRRLEFRIERSSWSLTSTSAFDCLSHLSNLVTLHLRTVTDQQCSSLAQLTGLQELEVVHSDELSPVGLRHLARLQQLTNLYFGSAFGSRKVDAVLQAQLSDRFQGRARSLVNKVRAAADRLFLIGMLSVLAAMCKSMIITGWCRSSVAELVCL